MCNELPLWIVLMSPLVAAFLCLFMPTARAALMCACGGVIASAVAGCVVIEQVYIAGPVLAGAEWLRLDPLSAYHLGVMDAVFVLSSLYALCYFSPELRTGSFSRVQAVRFSALWCSALAAMTLVLISNNLGMMWVGMEATTLLTAFLISLHASDESLEAMWKYILICSIGVGFAFLGTLLMAAASAGIGLGVRDMMLWSELRDHAVGLDPKLAKVAFLFLLVGYGTKAGLAPVHNWLPDAHSQAPAPVSAIFSGFMLNAALYCIMRYVPIVEGATGEAGWARGLLLGFGLLSILVAAAFVLFQGDLKRLLAYSSVEHLGIIAFGLGLGGLGTFAALFHTLGHALCKSFTFVAAGRLGQSYGGYDLQKMRGALHVSPLWGAGILVSSLALLGAAPFALFMSEFQIVWAAMNQRAYLSTGLFLLGLGIVFVGIFRHIIPLVFGAAPADALPLRTGFAEAVVVVIPLLTLFGLGIVMPLPLRMALVQAADVLDPGGALQASGLLAGGLP